MMDQRAEIWEETRSKRSGFGKLVLAVFVVFNLWMAFELFWLLSRIGSVRGEYAGNGWAQLGINSVANARLNEIFVVWALGCVLLGLAVLGTRGKRQMVRRSSELQK